MGLYVLPLFAWYLADFAGRGEPLGLRQSVLQSASLVGEEPGVDGEEVARLAICAALTEWALA